MKQAYIKGLNLLRSDKKIERLRSLVEIRFNRLLYSKPIAPERVCELDEFLGGLGNDSPLAELFEKDAEAKQAVQLIRSNFREVTADCQQMPFPCIFNADMSFAMLCYAFTRVGKPKIALETGIGYGISSGVTLQAMERNQVGKLISIDLPSLGDLNGEFIGIAVPEHLRHRWDKQHKGSSRNCLPKILKTIPNVDLFVSDSANVYTLQKYELRAIWPKLTHGGVMIFNNVKSKFDNFLKNMRDAQVHTIRQVEKSPCATAVVIKK